MPAQPKQTPAYYRWCFTLNESSENPLNEQAVDGMKKLLRSICKSWTFQLEKAPSTGTLHFQGSIKLKEKQRLTALKKHNARIHWEPTAAQDDSADLYAQKDDTRVQGPWSDKNEPKYVPRQIRGQQLRGWQVELKDNLSLWDTRAIHFVVDRNGGIGKSTFVTHMLVHHNAVLIPQSCENGKQMMEFAYSMIEDKKSDIIFMLDIPRAVKKDKWSEWVGCIESLKNGIIQETRYKGRQHIIDCPNIVVFANELPPSEMLTGDRWRVHYPPRFDSAALPSAPLLVEPAAADKDVIDLTD